MAKNHCDNVQEEKQRQDIFMMGKCMWICIRTHIVKRFHRTCANDGSIPCLYTIGHIYGCDLGRSQSIPNHEKNKGR